MGYKEIRKRALQDHNPDALIGLQVSAEFVKVLRQNFIKNIYRRVIDADECDSRIKLELEQFVIRIWQGSGSIFANVSVRPISAQSMFSHSRPYAGYDNSRANVRGRRSAIGDVLTLQFPIYTLSQPLSTGLVRIPIFSISTS